MELYADLVLIKEDTGKFYRGGDLKEIIMARQLYHYTSLETLHAIISEIDNSDSHFVYFKLRATNAYYLNDLTEGRLLLSALKKLGANEMLSEHGDDLNMWRCYASEGNGVAIGLDQIEIESAADYTNNCQFDKCEYVSLEELIEILKKKNIEELLKMEDIKPLAQLIRNMLKYKDKSFVSEAEWRIHDFNIETNFRVSNNLIIPFREIRVPVSAIQTIVIGPKCEYDRNSFSIGRFLKSRLPSTQDVQIIKSSVPLI